MTASRKPDCHPVDSEQLAFDRESAEQFRVAIRALNNRIGECYRKMAAKRYTLKKHRGQRSERESQATAVIAWACQGSIELFMTECRKAIEAVEKTTEDGRKARQEYNQARASYQALLAERRKRIAVFFERLPLFDRKQGE